MHDAHGATITGYEPPTKKQNRRIFSRIGLGLFLLVLVHQALVVVLSILVQQYAPGLQSHGWYLWLLTYLPLYLAAFPVMLLILRTASSSPAAAIPAPTRRMTAKGMLTLVAAGMGVTQVLNLLTNLLAQYLSRATASDIENPLVSMLESSSILANLLFVVLVAPVMEEYLFRGLLYKKLVRFGGPVYVVTSGLLFGLFHMNLFQIPYAFVLGVLFACVMYYTGEIKYCIALHMLVNLLGGGIGSVLLGWGNEVVLTIYSTFILLLALAGVVVAIVWFARHRQEIVFAPAYDAKPGPGVRWGNVGMVLYLLVTLGITIANLFAQT